MATAVFEPPVCPLSVPDASQRAKPRLPRQQLAEWADVSDPFVLHDRHAVAAPHGGQTEGDVPAQSVVDEGELLRDVLDLRRWGGLTEVVFVDAGRVYSPVDDSRTDWLTGVGLGLEFGNDLQLDFGYSLDDISQSLQILVRLQPTV